MSEDATPRLSVVTVSWQTGPRLKESIEAVMRAPAVDEFVLVNHGNPPETNAMLRQLAADSPKFNLVESGGNLGFSRGCNLGAEAASGDLVLFLNPDAVPRAGVARRLKEVAAGLDPDRPFIVGGRLLSLDGTEQRGGRRGELTPWTAVVGFLGLHRFEKYSDRFRDIHREREAEPDTTIAMPVVSGAAMLMRRSDFQALGGFDTGYFLHVEDIDLCRRVREAGGDVWFEPAANILHYGGTSRSSLFFVERHKAFGFIRYFWKFYPGPLERLTTLLAAPVMLGGVLARALFIYGRGRYDFYKHKLKARRRLKQIRLASGKARPWRASTPRDV